MALTVLMRNSRPIVRFTVQRIVGECGGYGFAIYVWRMLVGGIWRRMARRNAERCSIVGLLGRTR
jgi:hypothetical protein